MPILDGISAISVYNPSDGTAIEITKLIANTFEFSKVDFESGETGPTGNPLYKGDSSSCSFSFLDPDGSISTQLRTWKEARTRISFIAVGPSVAVMWTEKDHISITPSVFGGMIKGRGDRWDFEISRQGHGSHAIWRRANLLSGLGWKDDDNDEIADGYVGHDASSAVFNFSPNQQSVQDDGLSGIYYDLAFPFTSYAQTFTFGVEAVALHSVSISYKYQVQWLNFAKSSLKTVTHIPTATGRHSFSTSTDYTLASPFWLRVWPMIMPSTSSGTMVGKDPCLRIDGNTSYIQG